MNWILVFGVLAITAGLGLAALFELRVEGFSVFLGGFLAVAFWIVARLFQASTSGSGLRLAGLGFLLIVVAQIVRVLFGPWASSLVWIVVVGGIALMIVGIGKQLAQVLHDRSA